LGRAPPDRFAGVWFDNALAEEGIGLVRLCVGIVGQPDRADEEILSITQSSPAVATVSRKNSYRELLRIRDETRHDRSALCSSDGEAHITMVGIDPSRNDVVVGIDTDDQNVALRITEAYGPGLVEAHTEMPFGNLL
jgi:hypothetical protein